MPEWESRVEVGQGHKGRGAKAAMPAREGRERQQQAPLPSEERDVKYNF